MSLHSTAPWTIRTTGVIIFETEAARNDAAPLPGPVVLGRQVTVEGNKSGQNEDRDSELYLWELPPSTVESDLREYYANVGLKRIKFKMTVDYSSSVGVAFAGFESPEAAMAALRMGPPEIRGSKCRVKFSGYQADKEVCPCALARIPWGCTIRYCLLCEMYPPWFSEQYTMGAHRALCTCCACAVRKGGCFPSPVAMRPRVLTYAPYSPCWYTKIFLSV